MKRILLHNWKIKLTSLLMAFCLWYVIHHNVDPSGQETRRPAAGERARK